MLIIDSAELPRPLAGTAAAAALEGVAASAGATEAPPISSAEAAAVAASRGRVDKRTPGAEGQRSLRGLPLGRVGPPLRPPCPTSMTRSRHFRLARYPTK